MLACDIVYYTFLRQMHSAISTGWQLGGDIALQGEDRTARAPGPLTLSQYEIAAFLNMSRQWICKFILC